jgi:hypothetical protein
LHRRCGTAELGDYLAFLALITIGWTVAHPTRRIPSLITSAQAAA